jgi:hypothetical protein
MFKDIDWFLVQHEGEGPPDAENSNRAPGDKIMFWLWVVVFCLLPLITVVLLRQM